MSQAASQRSQVLARYRQGDRNFQEIDLRLVDLSQAQLVQADFAQALLFGVNFSGADLRQVNFAGANLSQADFRGADLRGADLTGANLRRANLADADLRDVELADAQLTGATMPDGRLFVATTPIEAMQRSPELIQQDLPAQDLPTQDLPTQNLPTVAKPDFQRYPKVIVPPLDRSFERVKADLPYWSLANLGAGFLLMGMQIAMSKSAPTLYVLPLLALLIFCFFPRFGSLLPVILFWSLLLTIGDPKVLVFPGLIVAAVFTYLKWMGPGVHSNPLRDTLWIGSALVFLIVIYGLLLFKPATALMMAVLIPVTGFGCLSLVDMNVKRFHRYEILLATQLTAMAGLLVGGIIGAVIGLQ
jgi:hypothetical protein